MTTRPPSQRRLIFEELLRRLALIQISGGYATDAGDQVFLGEVPELGPDDPDVAVAVLVGDDEPTTQGQKTFMNLPVEVQAVMRVDPKCTWWLLEEAVADVKAAIEVSGRFIAGYPLLRGATRVVPREAGSTTVALGVAYVVQLSEAWGQP